jgi:SAM-dependent methyltransferase
VTREVRNTPKYHEAVIAKNPLRAISQDDSFLKILEESTCPHEQDAIIELGCGSALRTLHLAKRYFLRPVLIDFTKIAVSLAKDNARRLGVPCHLIRCDVKRLPLRNGLFDILWAEGTHEHLLPSERAHAFIEIRRIAKTGARVLIFVPNVLNLFYHLEEFVRGRSNLELFDIPFTRSELETYMKNAGFTVKGGNGLEVFYPFFSYSLFNLRDIPAIIRPLYRIKRFLTRKSFIRRGVLSAVLHASQRLDRMYLPRGLLGLQVGIIAEAT